MKSAGLVLILLLFVSGCASYRPRPLTREAVEKRLAPPDLEEVRLQASSIDHPLLRPIPFDARDGISPEEAALLAVLANPALRAARDQRGIARAQVLQAGLLPDPTFSAGPEIPLGGDTRDLVTGFDMGLHWDLSSLFSRGARKDAARAGAASVDLQVAWQEWILAQQARWSAYRLALAREKAKAAEKEVRAFEKLVKALRRGVEIGISGSADSAAAEADYRRALASLAAARSEAEAARLALNRALGFPAERKIPLQKGIRFLPAAELPAPAEILRGLEKRRLDLLALRMGYKSSEARLREAVRAQFPRLDLGILGGRDPEGFETAGFELGLRLPLFDRNRGRIALARATRKALFDEYAARLFQARSEVSRLVEAFEGAEREWRERASLVSALEKRASLLELAAREGRGDILSYYREMGALGREEVNALTLEEKLAALGMALETASGEYGIAVSSGRSAGKEKKK